MRGVQAGLILASAAALAGCSASVTRFDLGNPETSSTSSGYGRSTTGRTAASEYGSAGYDRPAYRGGNNVARSELPPADDRFTTSAIPPQQADPYAGGYGRQQAPSYNAEGQQRPYGAAQQGGYGGGTPPAYGASGTASYGASGTVPPVAATNPAPTGETIEVRPGDTLYALSRRHGVSINELMTANGLTSPGLKPGQQLHLPARRGGSTGYATQTARPERENYETAAAPAPAQVPAEAPADWTRSYTVRQGDSLYAIARQNGVKLADLERYNGITDSRRVMPGTVLKLPGGGTETPPAAVAEAAPVRDSAPVAPSAVPSSPPTSSPQQPTLLNGSERVARAETPGAASDAVSPSAAQGAGSVAGSTKLRWPVAGKIISGFGPRPDGTHNDGVNLAAPMGTDVHAAENGVVAYAGDELKGYGNLVLIRHDNGWVTAYAHADEILVKRGDRIKRGQVIAKAGRTGQVDQPQVHFELRQGQKPVDPAPFMESL